MHFIKLFRIRIRILQEIWVTWPNFFGKVGQRSRSQEHIMYIAKICLDSVPGGPINFILGADIRTTPVQVGHKTVAMATLVFNQQGDEICILWSNISKTQRPINFKIGTYLQDVVLVTWPNLVKVGQRSKSYGYIMYSGKMCYNSITGGHINFVLGG